MSLSLREVEHIAESELVKKMSFSKQVLDDTGMKVELEILCLLTMLEQFK